MPYKSHEADKKKNRVGGGFLDNFSAKSSENVPLLQMLLWPDYGPLWKDNVKEGTAEDQNNVVYVVFSHQM